MTADTRMRRDRPSTRTSLAAVAVALALALGACTDDGDVAGVGPTDEAAGSGDEVAGGWDGTSPGQYATAEELADTVGCDTFEDRGVLATEGRQPSAVGTCNLDGVGLTLQVMVDASAMEQWRTDAETVCGRGLPELHYVAGDLWTINPASITEQALAERLADALDAEAVSITC
jgi:hypothetical protein